MLGEAALMDSSNTSSDWISMREAMTEICLSTGDGTRTEAKEADDGKREVKMEIKMKFAGSGAGAGAGDSWDSARKE